MDASTSPVKVQDIPGAILTKSNEGKDLAEALIHLTADQITAIGVLVKLFQSQNTSVAHQFEDTLPVNSQEMIFKSTETETKLIFSNKEVLDESEHELVEENPENVIRVSEVTQSFVSRSDQIQTTFIVWNPSTTR